MKQIKKNKKLRSIVTPAEEFQTVLHTEARTAIEEKPRIRYARVSSSISVSVFLSHEEFCAKVGKCFCESNASGRVGKTWHLIAGIPQVVPMIWTTHSLIKAMQRAGKVIVKVLV